MTKPIINYCLPLKINDKQKLSLTLSPDLYMEKGVRARHKEEIPLTLDQDKPICDLRVLRGE